MPDISKNVIVEYYEVVSQYLFFKKYPSTSFEFIKGGIQSEEYSKLLDNVSNNFEVYYGDFISAVLRDIPAVIIPLERIAQNLYLDQIFNWNDSKIANKNFIDLARGNSLARYFFTVDKLLKNEGLSGKSRCFLKEIGNYDSLLQGLKKLILLRHEKLLLKEDVKEINAYFENNKKMYQFLDKPHSNLFFDIIINQLAYPMHNNVSRNIRFKYIAKKNLMFTDVTIYDECRYIYEWLPGLHQILSAFENLSWQYVFRFALDGLVKMRQNYNNEFFFQGSIVSNTVKGFESKWLQDRISIGQ